MLGAGTEGARAPAPVEAGLPGRLAWESLLVRLDELLELDTEVEVLRGIAERVDGDAFEPGVVRACAELGLHATELRGTAAEAASAVGPGHPVVAVDAEGGWVLLLDRRGREVEVARAGAEPRWVSRAELAALVDPQQLGPIAWVAVDPPSTIGASVGRLASASPPPSTSPWVRLRGLVRQERHDVVVTMIYAVGVGLLGLATPIAVQALVNTVAFGTLLQPLAVLTLLLLAGLAFAGVLRALQAWVVEILQRRLFIRLVNDLSHRLPRVELAAFDRAHGPELVNRFFDLFTIQKAASSLLIGGLEVILTAAVGMVVLAFYHPLLLAFDVLLVVVVAGILFGLGRGATRTAVKESKAKYEVASWLEEVARHPEAFKLAGGPHLARQRADELAAVYLTNRRKHFTVVFRQLVGSLALHAFASAGILGIGGWLVIERQLTLGQLVAAELIVTVVVASFAKVGKHLETTYDLLAALDKVGQLLDLPLEARHRTAALTPPAANGARLRMEGATFGYDGAPVLLDGVDLELAPGARALLTGPSGGGRSTLVDLLIGLRRPAAGRVTLDGVDLADLDRAALRERTALVRGGEVIVGSIVDNVAFGRREIDLVRVREALRAVDLLDEVARLPDGLATRLMPDGSPLSRSQAARLVLARAIAGHPALLVIDGALDGLDPATRERLLDVVLAPDAPWTALVIGDDPSIRGRCTRVLALEDGRLTEGGAR
ncbi:MAG: ATP-binding cassette domain-containing protein [Sandaracinaceae bacterium]